MENGGMESIPSSSTILKPSVASVEIEESSDWRKLRKAIAEPVKEIILAEIDTAHRAHQAIDQLAKVSEGRRQIVQEFDANQVDPNTLLSDCQSKTQGLTPQTATLFLLDATQGGIESNPSKSIAFWQAMNMLRERWEHLDAQIIFFLQPHNYRLLSSHADHLKRWIPLKVHLIPTIRDTSHPLRQFQNFQAFDFESPSAHNTLKTLEAQLTTALERGESSSTFVTRYFLPMFFAAVGAADYSRAKLIYQKLAGAKIPEPLFSNWYNVTFRFHCATSNLSAATQSAENYLKWARKKKDRLEEAKAAFLFGILWDHRGKPSEADVWLKKSLFIFQEIGDHAHIARVLGELGVVARQRGDFQEAESYYQQALETSEKSKDTRASGMTYYHLGALAFESRHFVDAEKWMSESLQIATNLNDDWLATPAMIYLGAIAKEKGDLEAAEKWNLKVLELCQRGGFLDREAAALIQLGALAQQRGSLSAAEEFFAKAHDRFEENGNLNGRGLSLHQLGIVHFQAGNHLAAGESLIRAAELFHQINDDSLLRQSLTNFRAAYTAALPNAKEKLEARAAEVLGIAVRESYL
jgi:tetratricopeptide (TPR) repeat protein